MNYVCDFQIPLNIGVGKYSIITAVRPKDTHLENCSHWLGFKVAGSGIVGNIFTELCRLELKIKFKEDVK